MHEFSIAAALLARVEAEASRRRATAVRAVSVRIGELAGVDVELLSSAFRTMAERTICDGASLVIATVAARWACRGCGAAIAAGGPLRCPTCRRPAELRQGDELLLERIEMDVEMQKEAEETIDVRDARI